MWLEFLATICLRCLFENCCKFQRKFRSFGFLNTPNYDLMALCASAILLLKRAGTSRNIATMLCCVLDRRLPTKLFLFSVYFNINLHPKVYCVHRCVTPTWILRSYLQNAVQNLYLQNAVGQIVDLPQIL
jgi:hypothetical protein